MNRKSDLLKDINILTTKQTIKIKNAFMKDFCKFNINKIVDKTPNIICNPKFIFSNPMVQIFSLINKVRIIQNKKVNDVAIEAPIIL